MPKMNGAELAAAIKTIRAKLPVLLATGYANLPSGADSGLPRIGKPYQLDQLAEAISRAINARSEELQFAGAQGPQASPLLPLPL